MQSRVFRSLLHPLFIKADLTIISYYIFSTNFDMWLIFFGYLLTRISSFNTVFPQIFALQQLGVYTFCSKKRLFCSKRIGSKKRFSGLNTIVASFQVIMLMHLIKKWGQSYSSTYHLSELDRWVSHKRTVSVLLNWELFLAKLALLWKDDFFDNKLGRIEAMHLLSGSPVLTNDNYLRMAKDDCLDVEG